MSRSPGITHSDAADMLLQYAATNFVPSSMATIELNKANDDYHISLSALDASLSISVLFSPDVRGPVGTLMPGHS